MLLFNIIVLYLLLTWTNVVESASVPITPDTFDSVTSGKNVFIKFYESSCEHCQKIAPEWQKMANDWNDHPVVVIGEVDCRADLRTEKFCHEMEILGLPTLLYGEPSHRGVFLQSYGDEKSYQALSAFVKESLSANVLCSPGHMVTCEPDIRSQLASFWQLSSSQLEAQIESKERSIDDAILNFKREFDRMQKVYDDLEAEHDAMKQRIHGNIKNLKEMVESKKRTS